MAVPSGALISGIVQGGADALQLGATLLPNKLDKRNKQRVEDLLRLEELSAMGLTGAEMDVIRSEQQRARAASQAALEAQQARALAGVGAGSGEALARAQMAQQAEMDANQRIGESIAAADLERKREQQDELEALIAAQAERQAEKRQAVADFASKQAASTGDFFGFLRTAGQWGQGQGADTGAASEEDIAAVKDRFGLDDEDAAAAIEFFRQNPHLLEY